VGTFLLIDSRGPFESSATGHAYEVAGRLARRGNAVTVYLVHEAVVAARRGTSAAAAVSTLAGRATVLADSESLRERGIDPGELMLGVTPSGVDELVELLSSDGCNAWWH
jgi:sulfur relay (sulfurtransferase) complex TusBCD TusD component (DsrE family)